MAYAVGPKNRVYFTQPAMEEQLRYLGEAWMQIHPNLRRKHIGAALRRVGNRHVAPEYRSAARFFEGNEGYRGQYRSGVTKSGKASFRRMAGNLRRSVGGSKVYPGYPRDSALDMKFGYRMGRFGGSHAMLLDQGTKPRFRKGRFGAIQHAERHARLRQMLKSGVGKRSKRPITGGTIRNALKTSHAARYGYTGLVRPTRFGDLVAKFVRAKAQPDMESELTHAFNQAVKEQLSSKYQGVMRKYMAKFGNQGLYSPGRGFFQAARNKR